MIRWLPNTTNEILAWIGVALMAWSQWGWPAEPDVVFALGIGLVLPQIIQMLRGRE